MIFKCHSCQKFTTKKVKSVVFSSYATKTLARLTNDLRPWGDRRYRSCGAILAHVLVSTCVYFAFYAPNVVPIECVPVLSCEVSSTLRFLTTMGLRAL